MTHPPAWRSFGRLCLILFTGATVQSACGDQRARPPAVAASQPSPMPPPAASTTRLLELRQLMLRHAAWGGHGPLPQRGVNADSVRAVDSQLRDEDLPWLIDLLADDEAIVRVSAAIALSRRDPQAARHVSERLAGMPDGPARRRLQQALAELPAPSSP